MPPAPTPHKLAWAWLLRGPDPAAPPAERTLTKEWQEATNKKMREQKANPLKGLTSEGYKGKGWVV